MGGSGSGSGHTSGTNSLSSSSDNTRDNSMCGTNINTTLSSTINSNVTTSNNSRVTTRSSSPRYKSFRKVPEDYTVKDSYYLSPRVNTRPPNLDYMDPGLLINFEELIENDFSVKENSMSLSARRASKIPTVQVNAECTNVSFESQISPTALMTNSMLNLTSIDSCADTLIETQSEDVFFQQGWEEFSQRKKDTTRRTSKPDNRIATRLSIPKPDLNLNFASPCTYALPICVIDAVPSTLKIIWAAAEYDGLTSKELSPRTPDQRLTPRLPLPLPLLSLPSPLPPSLPPSLPSSLSSSVPSSLPGHLTAHTVECSTVKEIKVEGSSTSNITSTSTSSSATVITSDSSASALEDVSGSSTNCNLNLIAIKKEADCVVKKRPSWHVDDFPPGVWSPFDRGIPTGAVCVPSEEDSNRPDLLLPSPRLSITQNSLANPDGAQPKTEADQQLTLNQNQNQNEIHAVKRRKMNETHIVYPFFGRSAPSAPKIVALRILEYLDGHDLYAASCLNVLWCKAALDEALWE